jgi:glycosyltransferase involved in cell wall biosynthesis
LASTATCLPEIAGAAAILADPDDVAAMADGLYRLVTDQELRAELIPLGLSRSKEFSWDRTARAIEAVLGEIH